MKPTVFFATLFILFSFNSCLSRKNEVKINEKAVPFPCISFIELLHPPSNMEDLDLLQLNLISFDLELNKILDSAQANEAFFELYFRKYPESENEDHYSFSKVEKIKENNYRISYPTSFFIPSLSDSIQISDEKSMGKAVINIVSKKNKSKSWTINSCK